MSAEKLRLFVFVDAAFSNCEDFSSQIGYVIMLGSEEYGDKRSTFTMTGNLLHWSSTKAKRVTRSVLAAELFAMVAGFDMAFTVRGTIEEVLHRKVDLIVCTDSFSLYECITKLGKPSENRLMVDVSGLRQSYERREITEVRWIEGTSNPADAMTKERCCGALKDFVDANVIVVRTKAWVERSDLDQSE